MSDSPPTPAERSGDDRWERDVLRKLAENALSEQRTARRWGIFFKSLTFLYLTAVLVMAAGWFGAREGTLGKLLSKDDTLYRDLKGLLGDARQTLDGMHTQGDRHRLRAATPESKAQFLRGLLSRRFGRGAAHRHAAPKLRVASERQIERDGLLRVRL
jgi:hypothetical protein